MKDVLRTLISTCIHTEPMYNVCKEIFSEEYENFFIWPGSIGKHHSYEGGLCKHTIEVIKYCNHIALLFPEKIDFESLVVSALWHDVAKIWDYQLVNRFDAKCHDKKTVEKDVYNVWIKSEYHGRIHHINGSCAEFTFWAKIHKVSREKMQKIQHCIISHHGFNKEFGSPRMPESLEAVILHQSDMLSATYGDTK